jgi:hypothetical protein
MGAGEERARNKEKKILSELAKRIARVSLVAGSSAKSMTVHTQLRSLPTFSSNLIAGETNIL